jgi:outer membrane lipoprotein-sorting protein
MKARYGFLTLFALVFTVAAFAQSKDSESSLEQVLAQMDKTAAAFHTTEADFVWDQYAKVVDETDTQKGKVYFRRNGNETQMAADIQQPNKKYVLYSDSKVQVYQPPPADQITVYNAGNSRSEVESFLVLGFGGSGKDLLKQFDAKYIGEEKVGGVNTAKLDLVPKSQKVRNTFSHIVLWIDPARGVSVQQQLFDPSGDYRLAKYSGIQINQKIPDSVFKIKTTAKTKTISPQG